MATDFSAEAWLCSVGRYIQPFGLCDVADSMFRSHQNGREQPLLGRVYRPGQRGSVAWMRNNRGHGRKRGGAFEQVSEKMLHGWPLAAG
jgi:hypothetical protein